jgi:hypothetical protein
MPQLPIGGTSCSLSGATAWCSSRDAVFQYVFQLVFQHGPLFCRVFQCSSYFPQSGRSKMHFPHWLHSIEVYKHWNIPEHLAENRQWPFVLWDVPVFQYLNSARTRWPIDQ